MLEKHLIFSPTLAGNRLESNFKD